MGKKNKTNRGNKAAQPQQPGRRPSPTMAVIVLVAAIIVCVGFWWWKANHAEAAQLTVSSSQAGSAAASPDYEKLKGKWLRPDGGYVLEIKQVAADGKLDATYVNPNPINVARAAASFEAGRMKVYVELRDQGYPGNYYILRYDSGKDQLEGIYYHLGIGQQFEVGIHEDEVSNGMIRGNMMIKRSIGACVLVVAVCSLVSAAESAQLRSDPLPSWNDGVAKKAIVEFVAKVTKEGSSDFMPVAERIATFDNDGTLWCEQPMYFQFLFALDRVKAMAPQHPEWKDKEPFASLMKGDLKGAMAGGERSMGEIMMATHTGMTTAEFEQIVKDWVATAKHPKFKKPYTECVYQPMLELLAYLRANDFKTFIVSGGGIEFMRPWTEKVYGIPPEQVVGSSVKTKFELRDGKPVLVRLPEVSFVDDGAGKPVGINEHIGRRPIAAFGNSVGDQQMLEWTGAGSGARLMMLVHHDDAEREFAYGADSKIGTFSDALMEEAKEKKWTVISMKNDWKSVFAFEKP